MLYEHLGIPQHLVLDAVVAIRRPLDELSEPCGLLLRNQLGVCNALHHNLIAVPEQQELPRFGHPQPEIVEIWVHLGNRVRHEPRSHPVLVAVDCLVEVQEYLRLLRPSDVVRRPLVDDELVEPDVVHVAVVHRLQPRRLGKGHGVAAYFPVAPQHARLGFEVVFGVLDFRHLVEQRATPRYRKRRQLGLVAAHVDELPQLAPLLRLEVLPHGVVEEPERLASATVAHDEVEQGVSRLRLFGAPIHLSPPKIREGPRQGELHAAGAKAMMSAVGSCDTQFSSCNPPVAGVTPESRPHGRPIRLPMPRTMIHPNSGSMQGRS